jgi:hypothetical protein
MIPVYTYLGECLRLVRGDFIDVILTIPFPRVERNAEIGLEHVYRRLFAKEAS